MNLKRTKRIWVTVMMGGMALAHTLRAQTPYLDTHEIVFCDGRPMALSDDVKSKDVYSYLIQYIVAHQYTASDYGDYLPFKAYPNVGLSLTFGDFSRIKLYDGKDQRGDYGKFLSASICFTHYYVNKERFRLKGVIENGLAYAAKPYDKLRNPSSSIGGHLQVFFSCGLFPTFAMSNYEVSFGPQFAHYSNSGMYSPNHGINNASFAVRLKRAASEKLPICYSPEGMLPSNALFYYNVSLQLGFHTLKEQWFSRNDVPEGVNHGGRYSIYTDVNTSFDAMYRPLVNHSIGLGLDLFYRSGTSTMKKYYEAMKVEPGYPIRPLHLGLAMKHDSNIKDFAISIHVGYYLTGPHNMGNNSYTRIYERIGMKYYFMGNMWAASKYNRRQGKNTMRPFLAYYIKGNQFTAEQFELALGFSMCGKRGRY